MGDRAEYRRLVRNKAQAVNRLHDVAREKEAIQDKIDRLKAAKIALSDEYSYFSDVKKDVKNDIEQRYAWKGSRYEQFSAHGSTLISANQMYYAHLDDARDAINMEIMRLENHLYEQEGLLGDLRSVINSLAHRIENYFND